jgi:hypothetical protein
VRMGEIACKLHALPELVAEPVMHRAAVMPREPT